MQDAIDEHLVTERLQRLVVPPRRALRRLRRERGEDAGGEAVRVGLVQVDGKIPNLALMKLSAWRKAEGDETEIANPLWGEYDLVYRSKVFTYTPDDATPWDCDVDDGGTGYDLRVRLPAEAEDIMPDYDLFSCDHAIGFTTRGCIRKCKFCVVPEKEGMIAAVADLRDFVLPHHKWAVLLDNNLTALPEHLELIMRQSVEMRVAVDLVQAMDARLVTPEIAQVIVHGKHKSSIRFSMDNPEQDDLVLRGLRNMTGAGVAASRLMVYVLVGAPWLDFSQTVGRIEMLRRLGYRPFAMPYKALDGGFDASESPRVKQMARWTNRQELVNVPWKDYAARLPKAAVA